MMLSYVLVRGVRESAQTNNTMVLIKIVAILLFVFGAAHAVNTGNWHPFMPNGYSGVLSGGAIVFFTYIGFDSVSTAAEECGRPQRDMPIGIFATLAVCALLYGSVALVLTGIANWSTLNNDAPVANALKMIGMNRLRLIVTAGALLGMLSSLLVFQYGQARIWFAMSRDRLLPGIFSRVHPRYSTPYISTWVAGFVVGIPGRHLRYQLVRRSFEHRNAVRLHSGFGRRDRAAQEAARAQARLSRAVGPAAAGISIFCCLVLMLSLPLETWLRFLRLAGDRVLFIYFLVRQEAHR
jgi:APA family basic amino acid/polyamine antiporter